MCIWDVFHDLSVLSLQGDFNIGKSKSWVWMGDLLDPLLLHSPSLLPFLLDFLQICLLMYIAFTVKAKFEVIKHGCGMISSQGDYFNVWVMFLDFQKRRYQNMNFPMSINVAMIKKFSYGRIEKISIEMIWTNSRWIKEKKLVITKGLLFFSHWYHLGK